MINAEVLDPPVAGNDPRLDDALLDAAPAATGVVGLVEGVMAGGVAAAGLAAGGAAAAGLVVEGAVVGGAATAVGMFLAPPVPAEHWSTPTASHGAGIGASSANLLAPLAAIVGLAQPARLRFRLAAAAPGILSCTTSARRVS